MANKNSSKLKAPWWLTVFSYILMIGSVGYVLMGLSGLSRLPGTLDNILMSTYLIIIGFAAFYISFGLRRMEYKSAVYFACIVGLGIATDLLFTMVTGNYATIPKDIVSFAIRIAVAYSIFDYIKKANKM